ncbi:OLC1v1033199C1 [Oldenlandia corymbosa var. corymbosa]|uniref:OLC1v1033199C1 n=1 Tax=Oldenlandia corymbosa var. corymbosa TaxID=529605 RepID=A0AAV1CNM9_OLDCO|nr:OLC1v1033199C1 [Oldenlandia corymbosa var. corymbosa]
MWWSGGGNGGTAAKAAMMMFVRNFSRERAVNLRKINPKVSQQEAASIAEALYHIIKKNGPLTVSNTWNHAKEAGINGLNSKTHMKLMLKWMRGRNMLKQFCNQVGSSKKFLLSTLPEETNVVKSEIPKTGVKTRTA